MAASAPPSPSGRPAPRRTWRGCSARPALTRFNCAPINLTPQSWAGFLKRARRGDCGDENELIVPTNQTASLVATNDIRDIKPPVSISSGWEWLWWTLTILAAVALLVWAWRYWQKRRTQ